MTPPASRRLTEAGALPICSDDFPDALLGGLRSTPKNIPCKYFYDAEGSRLFEQICRLPEYYPTRTEFSLLQTHAEEITAFIGPHAEIMEFGAGAGEKIRPLLDVLHRPSAYIPVDISESYLKSVTARLSADYPSLPIHPLMADFTGELSWPSASGLPRVGFFPGSTIGNFQPEEARDFLGNSAKLLKGGGLLIGVDLVKDPAILHAAYNDRAGITAAFNRNLLARANREAGANFELSRFAHYAFYNPVEHRIEMYLISSMAQRVQICGRMISFSEGQAIHTEYSYKYTVPAFRELAASAGFIPRAVWTDPESLFSIHWLESP